MDPTGRRRLNLAEKQLDAVDERQTAFGYDGQPPKRLALEDGTRTLGGLASSTVFNTANPFSPITISYLSRAEQ